jgi:hypothetical protein
VTGANGGAERRSARGGGSRQFRIASAYALAACIVGAAQMAAGQALSQRGFIDGTFFVFPRDAANDPTNVVGDLLVREEAFLKPAEWIQFAAGVEARANSHDQVDDAWTPDIGDRTTRRPRLSVRRLAATFTRGPLTVDAGKQFIRWGKADIVNPTDRFAPRDFVNVIDAEFLAVTGVRGVAQAGDDTIEAVWVPRFTPSRLPLFDQRWTAVPAGTPGLQLIDGGAEYPSGAQSGVRWNHLGAGFEYSLSFYDGFNHLPNLAATIVGPAAVEIARTYPAIRMYGGDAAVPTRWFTLKGEAAYFTSSSPATDQYVLYVVQLERQTGEWSIVGGYAGEAITARRSTLDFAPDRGLTKSFVGRASYTIDTARNIAFEGAVRQTGDGVYVKAEYSQARGQHWRATVSGVGIGGRADDFLGQYRRNAHVKAALRYSF